MGDINGLMNSYLVHHMLDPMVCGIPDALLPYLIVSVFHKDLLRCIRSGSHIPWTPARPRMVRNMLCGPK